METEAYHVHQFQETVVPPTCKTNGYTLYRCHCGYEHRTNFKPLGTHNYAVTETVPATCEANGSITWQCATCGETVNQTVPPLGHDYSPWIVEAYPTCQQPGMQFRTCSRCGAREEAALPPTGHRCVPGTEQYTGGKLTAFFCENCGQVIPVAEAVPDTPVREGRYLPTKGIGLIAAITGLIGLISAYFHGQTPGVSYMNPVFTYGYPLLLSLGAVILFRNTDQIKGSSRFPRWLAAVPLVYALFWLEYIIRSLVISITDNHSLRFSELLPALALVGVPLLLAVVCLMRAEKKIWIFGITAVFACGCLIVQVDSFINIVDLYSEYGLWNGPWRILYVCTYQLLLIPLPLLLMAAITAPGKQIKK